MKTQRWLLPFTQTVDMQALEVVMQVAEYSAATVVALSLLAQVPRVRLEQIQQSKDFLEAVRWKAFRHQIAVEYYEVFTEDVSGSIATQVQNLNCQSIILLNYGGKEILLSTEVLKQLLTEPPAPLFLLTLPAREGQISPGTRFLSWLRQYYRQQGKRKSGHQYAETAVVCLNKSEKQQQV